jgi:peptidoglycan/LPS O-acetylase OafA/YrhL
MGVTPPREPPARAPRFLFIDALRGLAALAVVAFHFEQTRSFDRVGAVLPAFVTWLFRQGHCGVQVFFVLSGFVIAHSIARYDVTPRFVGRFLLRRSIRLDPPYWASILVVVLVQGLASRVLPGRAFVPPTGGQLVTHVLYLQELLGVPEINTAYWTLCLEIQFYLTFSLLMLGATLLRSVLSREVAFYAVVLPAVVFADLWPLGLGPFEVRGLFVSDWHLFLAGVLVWWAVLRPEDRAAFFLAAANVALLGVAATARLGVEIAVGAMAAGLILIAGKTNRMSSWLALRPWQFLGMISYSLYLMHVPVGNVFFSAAASLARRGVLIEVLLGVLAFAVTVLGSWIFYRAVEKPALTLSRRIGRA